ncbi:Type 1 glutamine amidotransferase-like domain-containing protein [Chryseobacterium wangxinyae]|uniref:Type 1 glutamine amidotransferase-like domain-containing protein n=1 Tax=Chryseobacterium sp. CY350 TaxID=2997336 RepID=UPI00226FE8EA|nr:Type 1 glutamine amidotransferase-like domain-containing protein [Chryseobacterium sp. CY350]MCY0976924.1 Type 1 glutamine amidotransferase-like domain-containing protein [Chryseobacterium sp. CY350]WBZ96924.1 Type 1 glutamine amidotransferase-like domain-containing protein [Chryseobacterium sp. CY350]
MAIHPKGKLVFINCNEGLDNEDNQWSKKSASSGLLTFLTKRKIDRIEIITSDSESYVSYQKFYKQALAQSGFKNFDCIHFTEDCISNAEVVNRITKTNVVLFVGNHSKLYSLLKDTTILNILHMKYMQEQYFTISGVSKGALYIPGKMICNTTSENSFKKCLELTQGLGFLNNCIIDSQYSQRTGYDKLAYTVVKHHDLLGIGLGSGTVLIVQNGFVGMCKGDGTIMLVNAMDTKHLSGNFKNPNRSFYVKNLKGRVMIDGSTINLQDGGYSV